MEEYKDSFTALCKNRTYLLTLAFTAAAAYGFMVIHPTVGIDDTPYAYYFQEGLVAVVGRWVLYLLNKILFIGEFAPFVTDLAGVLILMAAVTVWAALFRTVLKGKIPEWGYLFFAAVFLSCPLISEVYTYFLHNGISIGYLCVGLSLCFMRKWWERPGRFSVAAGTVCFLWVALGCYESFMVVWLLGVFLLLLTERYAGVVRRAFPALCMAAAAAVCAVALRSLMIAAVTGIFGLGSMKEEAVQRSVSEMASWMLEPGAAAEFAMVLKRVYVMYGVFAFAYLPVRIFVMAAFLMLAYGIYGSIRKKDLRIFLLTVGSFVVSFLLVLVEGKSTLYRSAQFLPVICGYGALLLCLCLQELKGSRPVRGRNRLEKFCGGAVIFMLSAILWNQCADMNRWFYVDHMKYEAARETAARIACELERQYGTVDKPVMFTGTYQIPRGLIQDAYVPYGSETFYRMKRWADPIDGHLLEKFYREYGVWVAQTPALSVIDWGRYAFGTDEELIRFFRMHGHELQPYLSQEDYAAAETYSLDLPKFPQEGSIVDMGDHIIVHF
ncbi:MAG: glucosyltransferase domain-containing protein [Eubacterium sp.]|nr:glucosyltransferase domain-containing protein [Eubacterium sp.]MCM1215856.1 glucosyltransferase domain-containing protein [Lachnospiraceae bacterium]MCM1239236.1 glucosyltransferase domain-containing protein [Lachnospiraceae bacterium]